MERSATAMGALLFVIFVGGKAFVAIVVAAGGALGVFGNAAVLRGAVGAGVGAARTITGACLAELKIDDRSRRFHVAVVVVE